MLRSAGVLLGLASFSARGVLVRLFAAGRAALLCVSVGGRAAGLAGEVVLVFSGRSVALFPGRATLFVPRSGVFPGRAAGLPERGAAAGRLLAPRFAAGA